jgi:exosortase A
MKNIDIASYHSKTKILLMSLLIIGFVVVFFPVWEGLVLFWIVSDDYSHGFFIVPVFLFIMWQKKDEFAKIDINPKKWGFIWILFFLLLYLFAIYAEIKSMASVTMILFLSGAIFYLFGYGILKEMIFPIFILLFMIPVPSQIYATLTIPLQLFVSAVSTWFAFIINIPIYREGNVIHLPEHMLQVTQACSGLRSMISLLTLSAVFGYLTLKSNTLRAVLFFLGIPIAIVVNVIRVSVIVCAFYYFNYDLTRGDVHTLFGVVIFFLALIIIAITRGVLSIWDRSAT